MPVRPTAALTALLTTVLAATALTACGTGSDEGPDTLKVSYKQSTDNSIKVMDTYLAGIKKQFEREHPGKKVEFVPIKAPDSEYYTKLQQMLRSPRTAP
ncbi:extracellular solute-binding protein, partial [Streptomyces sp. SID6137]|nr:extracellular solute-binding protein [Streptomyces sp. SID6137]